MREREIEIERVIIEQGDRVWRFKSIIDYLNCRLFDAEKSPLAFRSSYSSLSLILNYIELGQSKTTHVTPLTYVGAMFYQEQRMSFSIQMTFNFSRIICRFPYSRFVSFPYLPLLFLFFPFLFSSFSIHFIPFDVLLQLFSL